VTKTAIDLEKRTLLETRTKTGVPRIGVLWQRTIDAIKAYQDEHPHDFETVFVSEIGRPYTPKHLGRLFRSIRDKAGVDETVSFDMIRDGANSAAIDGNADPVHVEMLLGHKNRDSRQLLEAETIDGCGCRRRNRTPLLPSETEGQG